MNAAQRKAVERYQRSEMSANELLTALGWTKRRVGLVGYRIRNERGETVVTGSVFDLNDYLLSAEEN